MAHATIFEIRSENFKPKNWEKEFNFSGHFDIVTQYRDIDYFGEMPSAFRCEMINAFFGRWPDRKSFNIIQNEPDKTAVIEFVGNLHQIHTEWQKQILSAASKMTLDYFEDIPLYFYHVRDALNHPMGADTTIFYLKEFSDQLQESGGFLTYLRQLSKKNEGKPFKLYIGQVFDYHF